MRKFYDSFHFTVGDREIEQLAQRQSLDSNPGSGAPGPVYLAMTLYVQSPLEINKLRQRIAAAKVVNP